MSFFDKIRFGLTSVFLGKFLDWKNYENISTLDWFYRWAGKNATDALWKPMLDIKFGKFAPVVPLTWMIGRLRQRFSSRKGGDEQLGYLHGSLKTLLDALLAKLPEMGVTLLKNERLETFDIENGVLKGIKTNKQSIGGGQFLVTIPGIHLPQLLEKDAPELAKKISNIEYFGAVCTILELDRSLSHIYWLNVADAGFPFGGVIEHTNFIPKEEYQNSNLVYLSRYFAMDEDLASMNEAQIKAVMIPPLKRIYPEFSETWIKNTFVFKTNTAATVCDLNFSEKVPKAKTEIENLFLANMAHIYPDERSTNNSVRVAAETCRIMGIDATEVPTGSSLSGQIGF